MNRYKFTLAVVGCLVLGSAAIGQQPEAPKKRIPVLTSDDLTRSQNRSGETVVMSAVEPAEWAKFAPEKFHISMDLPGGLELTELPVPDYMQNELNREYGDAKFYFGGSNALGLSMLYLPSKKASVSPAELKVTAGAFMKQMAFALDHNATFTTEITGKSKVSMKANLSMAPEAVEMLGTMQSRGKEIWLVILVFRRSDETARKIALRIISSTTLY